MLSRSPVRFAVDKCLQADIPTVLNGSFVAIVPSLRMSGFRTDPNVRSWRKADRTCSPCERQLATDLPNFACGCRPFKNAEFFWWARKNISAISPTGPAIADVQANAK
jgi:hypothetical protein